MRTLKFIVNKQTITQDPNCDFSGLFPGTEKYLRAEFSFSSEWKNAVKVAAFWSTLGTEYDPQELKDGESCMIPTDALEKPMFKIQIIGKKGKAKLATNRLSVYQRGEGKR